MVTADTSYAMALAALLSTAVACGPAVTARHPPTQSYKAAALLAQAESVLLGSDHLRIRSEILATGAVQAKLSVEVDIAGRKVRFAATGTFAGKPVHVAYVSDGKRTNLGIPAPPHTVEAIVIGITRMGLLHNVVKVMGRSPPDRAMGGVRDWVRAKHVELGAPRPSPAANEVVVQFALHVAGRAVGSAEVWIDEARHVPTGRVQSVHFPQGTMNVNETYQVVFNPTVPVDFSIGGPTSGNPSAPAPPWP